MLEFIFTTLFVYLLYYIFMISKYDNHGRLKKRKDNALINKIKNGMNSFIFNRRDEKEEILRRGRKPRKMKTIQEDIKIPTEVEILLSKYHVDLARVNYKSLLKVVGMMCSIDIGLIVGIIALVSDDDICTSLLIGAVLVIPVILMSYSIVGNYYKRKGLVVKDEKRNVTNRKNRK